MIALSLDKLAFLLCRIVALLVVVCYSKVVGTIFFLLTGTQIDSEGQIVTRCARKGLSDGHFVKCTNANCS